MIRMRLKHYCPLLLKHLVFQTVINTMCGFGVQTQNHLDATKSIYPVGCADRAVIWIESHLLLVGALTLGLALPQVTFSLRVISVSQTDGNPITGADWSIQLC